MVEFFRAAVGNDRIRKYLAGYASTFKRQLYFSFVHWQILVIVVFFAPSPYFSIHLLLSSGSMIAYVVIVITLCLICMIHVCPLSQSIIV